MKNTVKPVCLLVAALLVSGCAEARPRLNLPLFGTPVPKVSAAKRAALLLAGGASVLAVAHAAKSPERAEAASAAPGIAGSFDACKKILPPGFRYEVRQIPGVVHPGRLRALCFTDFAVIYSGESKTPVASIERLTRSMILEAKQQERAPSFYAEARLPAADRASLDDYAASGYDRGHQAPSGDFSTPEGRSQSNSLANIVPQDPTMNRGAWSQVEQATRRYIERQTDDSPVWVVTGPVFSGTTAKLGANKVWIPSSIYKMVVHPAGSKSWAQILPNDSSAKISKPVGVPELEAIVGAKFF